MIVVDVNVVAYLLIQSESTALAQAVWQRDPAWLLPPLWRHEFLNILATYVKTGGATQEEARSLWSEALRLFAAGEREIEMEQALALATEHRISAYDGQYVALAEALRLPLITADRRLRKVFPGRLFSMEEFCSGEASPS